MKFIKPLVTVLLPVYNGMPWIKEAVYSILEQSYVNFELIIIDDGSTDGTKEYLKSLTDQRIILKLLEKNQGIVSALNSGLNMASGKYVARMDADDIASLNRLKEQVEFMEANPDYVLVASDIEAFTHDLEMPIKELDEFQHWYNNGHSDEEIRSIFPIGNCINHPSAMYRTEKVIKSGGYLEEYRYAEDYEMFWRFLEQGKFAKLSKKLLKYRIHTGQISLASRDRQRIVDVKIKSKFIRQKYCSPEEKIIIWGAGKGGQLLLDGLKRAQLNVIGFIDKNQSKWGTFFNGVPILGDEGVLFEENFDYVLIATTPGREYAMDYLNQRGLEWGKNYLPVW